MPGISEGSEQLPKLTTRVSGNTFRAGDCAFLEKPPPPGVQQLEHTEANSIRAEHVLEALVIDLQILDAQGRVAIEALAP